MVVYFIKTLIIKVAFHTLILYRERFKSSTSPRTYIALHQFSTFCSCIAYYFFSMRLFIANNSFNKVQLIELSTAFFSSSLEILCRQLEKFWCFCSMAVAVFMAWAGQTLLDGSAGIIRIFLMYIKLNLKSRPFQLFIILYRNFYLPMLWVFKNQFLFSSYEARAGQCWKRKTAMMSDQSMQKTIKTDLWTLKILIEIKISVLNYMSLKRSWLKLKFDVHKKCIRILSYGQNDVNVKRLLKLRIFWIFF